MVARIAASAYRCVSYFLHRMKKIFPSLMSYRQPTIMAFVTPKNIFKKTSTEEKG